MGLLSLLGAKAQLAPPVERPLLLRVTETKNSTWVRVLPGICPTVTILWYQRRWHRYALCWVHTCARYDILVKLKTRDQLTASQYNSTALVMTCVNTANGYLVNGHWFGYLAAVCLLNTYWLPVPRRLHLFLCVCLIHITMNIQEILSRIFTTAEQVNNMNFADDRRSCWEILVRFF